MIVGYKLVVIDDSSPFEFEVVDDINRKDIPEIHEYLMEHLSKYPITVKFYVMPLMGEKEKLHK